MTSAQESRLHIQGIISDLQAKLAKATTETERKSLEKRIETHKIHLSEIPADPVAKPSTPKR